MSVKVMSWVWEHSSVKSASELVLLLAIADDANDDGTGAWPSLKRLSELTRMSQRSVSRTASNLAARDELEVQLHKGPGGRVNLYAIPMDGTSANLSPDADGVRHTPLPCTGTVLEPSGNPSPTESGLATVTNPDDLGRAVLNDWWTSLRDKPHQPYEHMLPIVRQVLKNGMPSADVRQALDEIPTVSLASFDVWRNKRAGKGRAPSPSDISHANILSALDQLEEREALRG